MKVTTAESFERDSGYMRPVIFGHQKWMPARNAMSMPPTMTKWKVGDDEVGLGEVDIHAERAEEDAGEAADGEEAHEPEGVKHRGFEGDGTLLESERTS